ncbi:hypothetical protein F7725_009100 [Dissostichus mawsoni]|uniref:Cysteine and tyrosine-rich protein 1 n=1 Tax=Dissostichus mawsoni TaxID=36200 RepID=A0A7J5Z7W6_DISMA|nr:hypothetical protein F7725_009100 [Dissostichus mawsoni]
MILEEPKRLIENKSAQESRVMESPWRRTQTESWGVLRSSLLLCLFSGSSKAQCEGCIEYCCDGSPPFCCSYYAYVGDNGRGARVGVFSTSYINTVTQGYPGPPPPYTYDYEMYPPSLHPPPYTRLSRTRPTTPLLLRTRDVPASESLHRPSSSHLKGLIDVSTPGSLTSKDN